MGTSRRAQVVPFHTGGLARLAPDALRDVDELCDLDDVANGRRRARWMPSAGECRGTDNRPWILPPLRDSRRVGALDIDEKRLVLRRVGVGVADRRASACWRRSPSSSWPMKPQWIGTPITWTGLLSQISGLMRLVTYGLGLDRSALRPDAYPVAGGDALLLAPGLFTRSRRRTPAGESR